MQRGILCISRCAAFIWLSSALALQVYAGVTNPNLSVIGQPVMSWNDDGKDPSRERAVFDVGETEIVIDDYLNPYARGWFTLAVGGEGVELEEGYFEFVRGLPWGLNLKAGQYRAGFGKLNAVHPHAYPFAERFGVLANYLPGEESLNETGVQLSARVPSPGETSVVAAVDWLRGDSFRIEREESGAGDDPLALGDVGDRAEENRPGVLGRLSAFLPIDDRSGLELGLSATHGTNNVAAGTRTTVLGADAKLKYWNSARSYLLLQAEALRLDREDAAWAMGEGYASSSVDPFGFYLFADYNWNLRWNAGVSYEHYEQPTDEKTADQAFGVFAGFAVMEETTVFRLGYERYLPGEPTDSEELDDINTFTLRVIYSMGPHKAHQF